ncbi:MAG: hypothetical protein ABJE47_00075 [bacterium]
MLAPLDSPVTDAELSWWRAKRRRTILKSLAGWAGILVVYGAGNLIGHHFNVFIGALVLLVSSSLPVVALLTGNRALDIRAKRAADYLAARQAEFLALLAAPEQGQQPTVAATSEYPPAEGES